MRRYLTIIFIVTFAVFRVVQCSIDSACVEKKGEYSCQYDSSEKICIYLNRFIQLRQEILSKSIKVARKSLPSPHSELVLGMVVGADEFSKVPRFKRALKDAGLIHVVVVSGFNINLVFSLVANVVGSTYKLRNLLICESVTLFYSFLTGFEPPVIRAWIMSSVLYIGKYYGREINVLPAIIFTAAVMLILDATNAWSLSFQLSFLATLGLVLYEGFFKDIITKIFKREHFILSDLSSTLAAQVLVLPLLSYNFGSISVISPLANMLTLWIVPIATILGGVYLLTGFVGVIFSYIFTIPIYILLDLFVWLVEMFSNFSISNVSISISLEILVSYYIVLALITFYSRRNL
ncbi:ComEC/Rec2 family competence protein [Patescibacteria group bacterium]|nr:ComEC/Rec2 family competence protein [Patescibacteria group bacterium]